MTDIWRFLTTSLPIPRWLLWLNLLVGIILFVKRMGER